MKVLSLCFGNLSIKEQVKRGRPLVPDGGRPRPKCVNGKRRGSRKRRKGGKGATSTSALLASVFSRAIFEMNRLDRRARVNSNRKIAQELMLPINPRPRASESPLRIQDTYKDRCEGGKATLTCDDKKAREKSDFPSS
jgi:hypothetical protein